MIHRIHIFFDYFSPPRVKVNDADIQLSSLPSSRRTVNIAQCSTEDGRKVREERERRKKNKEKKKEEKKKEISRNTGDVIKMVAHFCQF